MKFDWCYTNGTDFLSKRRADNSKNDPLTPEKMTFATKIPQSIPVGLIHVR
jgi:hypothetical protein